MGRPQLRPSKLIFFLFFPPASKFMEGKDHA